jgi:photosystem II stability/assembly factor-like uncharacterized protein
MTATRLFALGHHALARAQRAANGRWTVDKTLSGHDVRCLEVDPLNPDQVYAGTQGQGVFRSADGGRTWQPAGLPGVIVKSLAASPHRPGLLYAGTKSPPLLYRSEDGGAHWEELPGFRRVPGRWYWLSPAEPPFSAYVLALALSPHDPDVLLAGIEAGAVLRSADAGRTWGGHRPGAGRDCHQLFFHPRQPGWVYQAHGGGPVLSRDAGLTWTQPRAGLPARYCFNVAADAQQPERWYAVVAPVLKAHGANAQACVVRSLGGAPWQRLSAGLPPSFDRLPLLAAHPSSPGELYLASAHGDVWHTTNCGDTWQQLPLNLGPVWFRLVIGEPS